MVVVMIRMMIFVVSDPAPTPQKFDQNSAATAESTLILLLKRYFVPDSPFRPAA